VRVGAVAVNPIDTYIRGGLIAADLPRYSAAGAAVSRFARRLRQEPELHREVVGIQKELSKVEI
jgi:hypothetical protein